MYNSSMGTVAITLPAINAPLLLLQIPCRTVSPGASGIRFKSLLAISGHIKSFHANRAVKIASDARLDRVTGTMIFVNTCHGLHPSITAASSSSFGSAIYCWRRRNVPNALTRAGNISANTVFNSLIFESIIY